jgi:hypothetical protein
MAGRISLGPERKILLIPEFKKDMELSVGQLSSLMFVPQRFFTFRHCFPIPAI